MSSFTDYMCLNLSEMLFDASNVGKYCNSVGSNNFGSAGHYLLKSTIGLKSRFACMNSKDNGGLDSCGNSVQYRPKPLRVEGSLAVKSDDKATNDPPNLSRFLIGDKIATNGQFSQVYAGTDRYRTRSGGERDAAVAVKVSAY